MPKLTYNWKRFWCPRTGSFRLLDYGFLYVPDPKYESSFGIVSFEAISSTPCLVLLGEAGMGKSVAVEQAYQEIKISGAKCLWLRLGDYGSEAELCQAIFRNTVLQDWVQGEEHLYLFLDSLDEGLLNIDILTRILKRELNNLPCDRLSLRITCRTADWDFASSLEVQLQEKYDNNVDVYELAPLTRLDVIEAAQSNELDSNSFIKAVFDRDAVPLAIKPTTLKFLINTFKQGGQFPLTQKELYFKGCKSLCIETNHDRIESGKKGKLSESQRLVIAARIAAIFIFSNRSAIWTGIDLGDVPSSDVALTEIYIGSERIDDQDFQITEDSIRETLSITSLFSSRGVNRLGFAHQTYAEFLAAWYVAEHHNLPLVQIMSLLTTPEDPDKRLVPQLHETAAWIASMRQDILKEIIKSDPDVILRSDIPTDSSLREVIVENLLKSYDQGFIENHEYQISNYRHLIKLKHPKLASQLLPYVQGSIGCLTSRDKAIDIAEICQEKSLQSALADLALNSSEDINLRGSASYALTLIGDSDTKGRLKPLAIAELIDDKFSRLKDYSLMAVFPEHLNAKELFQSLVSPRKRNLDSGYSKFLSTELVKNLNPSDLPTALKWVISQGERHFPHPFESAINAIIQFGWNYIENPNILELFTKIVLIQWKVHQPVNTDITEKYQFEKLLLNSDSKRRLLIKALVLVIDEKDNLDPYFLVNPTHEIYLLSKDLNWLIEKAKASESDKVKNIWLNLVLWSINSQDNNQIEILYAATQEDKAFQERFGLWFKAIELDSDKAKEMQAHYLKMQKYQEERERNTPKKISDQEIKERIDHCLVEFEAGNLDAWWWLNSEMTLDPNSPYYGNNQTIDISDLYGWKSADLETKNRIINAALQYTEKKNGCSNDWIGTDKHNLDSYSGCKALCLLLKEDLSSLNKIIPSVWVKWTPTIVAFPHYGGVDDNHLELMRLAYSKAPTEFINTLLKMIDSENKKSCYVFIIDKLKKCWDDRLKDVLLNKVKALDLEPKCIGQLLEELLKHNHEQSRDFAKLLLSWSNDENRKISISAAKALLNNIQESDWDIIWQTITKDLDFAREALEFASYGLRNNFLILNERQLADLYIWMERQYPHTEDPVHEGIYDVGKRESIADFRDYVLTQLRETGTLRACQEIQRVIQHFPNYDLNWHLGKAQNALRKKSWKPPKPSELLQLVNNGNKRLIQDGNQLLDVLLESLKRLELKLQGETPAARDIWDLDSKNTFKPVNENLFSNYVKRHFDQDLKLHGIIANREVELRSQASGAVQERTDIHVDAVIRNYAGEIIDSITIIIEAKGCWHDELDDAMQTQLVNQYLQDNDCQYGLYLIGWFNCSQWDKSDSRYAKSPKITLEQAREQFAKQAENLSQGGINVKSFVLNASLG